MCVKTTKQVAIELGVSESVVQDIVRREIAPPEMLGAVRIWRPADVARLRAALAARAARIAARRAHTQPTIVR